MKTMNQVNSGTEHPSGVGVESPLNAQRHCATCTCGLTHVEWSDREGWVDLADPEAVASIVMGCALDHSYDRTGDGVPYGFPDELRKRLAPVVAKHLSGVEPDWENKSVYMDYEDGSRDRFKTDLQKALNEPERDADTR